MPPQNQPLTHAEVKAPEDLDRLDKAELIAFLGSDREDKIDLWYAWRETDGSRVIDLEKANLSRAHLEGAYLSAAHLEGANLIEAYLEGASLKGAYLEGAALVGARLEGAVLVGAQLEETVLIGARLEGALLSWTRLEGASLRGANLKGADLIEACLEGTDLRGANLEEANLRGASLKKADLRQAHFRDSALSILEDGGLNRVRLYQTYFRGVLSLRYEQFLENENPRGKSTIWEHTEGRFSEAKDIYKTLKGYFEDAGDYEGANWAYKNEQDMEKLMYVPRWARWLYPAWKWEPSQEEDERGKVFWKPSIVEWLRLEIADKLAGYGLSLSRPLMWLALISGAFTIIYIAGGMVTAIPGCGYAELAGSARHDCAPTYNLIDNFLFSLGALTSTEIGTLRPYLSHVGILITIEILLGIALTGLFGFVLGNKLRNS
jgi:uncharacterized protein YjbI with pentapeptide repeats